LWSRFPPEEYATLTAFLGNPEKAWKMYRALGDTIRGRLPGPAHAALAELEEKSRLKAVITQNIDGLHQMAGSKNLIELHGDNRSLHCVACGASDSAVEDCLREHSVPRCCLCESPLKPNFVLFEEAVREMNKVDILLNSCDLLMVIGTSATVYPAAEFPHRVLGQGGRIVEFNLEETSLTPSCQFSLQGRVDETVPRFVSMVLRVCTAERD
jgi:NAD-dependent deacetylase